ncbi:MAG: glycosyltransferase family 1 protein [Patescibacteria group bacterium]|nr:glycosyltransferase family 1 protein [Patescibacteria group bacterium]
MLIGIDASRAYTGENSGTENYSRELIEAILKLPEAKKHEFRLYTKKTLNWSRLWTQGGLAWELWQRPVDVLWIPAHTLPILRSKKIKTVVTIHGLEYEYLPEYYDWRKRWYLNKSTEYAVKQADKIIAVSKWTKKQLVERLGAEEKKIKVIYEGVSRKLIQQGPASKLKLQERTFMRQIRYKYGIGKDYILFIGTIQPRKNLVRLIEAFATLNKGETFVKESLELVIGGKKGWMAEEIYQAPKKFGVVKQVKFIGRVADADLAGIYKGARLFIWPSLMEGFGLPVLEAMSLGVPVITSNRGALPEVVGEAGLLVDPEKVEEISGAMELVLNNQELEQGLIEKGYRQAKKFSWQKAAKQTLEFLTT